MTPYYDEDGITIYHGDCLDVLPSLPPVDLVFTSPPYNLGKPTGGICVMEDGYEEHDDAMPDEAYVRWQQDVLSVLWAGLPDTGAIFYNHKPLIRDGLVTLPLRLVPPECSLRQIIVWDRIIGANWSPTFFQPRYEWLLLLAKSAFRLTDKTASHAGDVWRLPVEANVSGHPCPFPVQLPQRAIGSTSARGILDPFMGSGTTLRAAKDLGIKAIGIEISERYCEIAAERLAQGVLDLSEPPTTEEE